MECNETLKRKLIKELIGVSNDILVWSRKRNISMRDATSTTFLQHFYNKSHVVSCYWFKFETNIKITFLPQQ